MRCTPIAYLSPFLLTPLREGRLDGTIDIPNDSFISTHAPAGGATSSESIACCPPAHFYSRPCGRGDATPVENIVLYYIFLLTPLREGRPATEAIIKIAETLFLLTPLREGRRAGQAAARAGTPISTHAPAGGATTGNHRRSIRIRHFYSRPCGRGDFNNSRGVLLCFIFLLTPLREGRPCAASRARIVGFISTHAPAGGATRSASGVGRSRR